VPPGISPDARPTRDGAPPAAGGPSAGPCLTAIREHNRKLREVAADLVATVGRTPATTHFDT
jgi:hypothetical protein